MKVILIKDVARLGRRNEVKEVPDGHAINFLIPRKLAVIATPDSMKRLNTEAKMHDAIHEHSRLAFTTALEKMAAQELVYSTEANEQGVLFKGIHAGDISEFLEKHSVSLSKDYIVLDHPIKHVGTYEVPVVMGELHGICHLVVSKK